MIPTETVGNPDLESEYLASCIVQGIIYTPEYLKLRMFIAGLPFVDVSNKLTELLTEIQKMTVATSKLVEKPAIKSYYYGENPDLKSLIKKAHNEVVKQIELYDLAVPELNFNTMIDMSLDIEDAPMTYEDLGEQVAKYQAQADYANQLGETLNKLKVMEGQLNALLEFSSKKNEKLLTKGVTAGTSTGYQLFLTQLIENMGYITDNIQISMVVGKVIDAIQSTWPKDNLDPYLTDVSQNMIEALTDPKSFYSMYKNDQIVSSAVGQMFGHCYPEFYSEYQDIGMEDYDSLDYQSQTEFRKCFGLDEDNSELTTLCSQYVKLGFSQHQ